MEVAVIGGGIVGCAAAALLAEAAARVTLYERDRPWGMTCEPAPPASWSTPCSVWQPSTLDAAR